MTFLDLLPHRWLRFKDTNGPPEDSMDNEPPNGDVQHQKDDQSSSSIDGNPKPLKRYARRINPQFQSALCQLPFEILDPIIKQLPASSATTLALTCKGLWNIRREEDIQRLRQDSGQRAFFLSLLGDHSDYLPCWSCLVLHRYGDEKKKSTKSSGPHGLKLCSNIEAHSLLVPGCPHYNLSYLDLQLALRGARLGLEHGMTLRNHHCTTNGHHSKNVEREIIITHRIIDRRLFLKQEFRIRAPLDQKMQKRDKHALFHLVPHPNAPSLGCPHSQKSLANLAASAIAHHQLQTHLQPLPPPSIYPLNQTPLKNQEPRGSILSYPEQLPLCPSTCSPCRDQTHLVHQCRYCTTDFHVSVAPLPSDPQFCTLTLTAYKDMGPSSPIQPSPLPPRNPNNPTHTYFHTNLWASHTSSSFAIELDRRNRTVHPYTTISLKHVWKSRTTTHPGADAAPMGAILHSDYIRPVGYGNGGGSRIGSNGCEVLQVWKYDRSELAQAIEWREMGFWTAERSKWRGRPGNRARRILKGLGYCFWCCCLCGCCRVEVKY